MNIPLNGRIAIIDDKIDHALPLMNELSKRQLPYTYFSGELEYLPEEDDNYNDIRILFLDINLIDNSEHDSKQLKSKLVPVLKRVISEDNYPYVIIYWSRHEIHKDLIENDIFINDLDDRSPIGYMSAIKSDYFNNDGTKTDEYDANISNLFNQINNKISEFHSYNYLLQWENLVHLSTDKTLQDIFSTCQNIDSWINNSNYIINKLGDSYAGKSYANQKAEKRIKSSFSAINEVLIDTLGKSCNFHNIEKPKNLTYSKVETNSIYKINRQLLISEETNPIFYSGSVIEILSSFDKEYEGLLHTALSNTNVNDEIKSSWKKIWIIVTPLCDCVQGKTKNHRLVKGILIKKELNVKNRDKLVVRNEAVFESPYFEFESTNYSMVIDFRHFFTMKSINNTSNRKPLFRIRQQLLSEIQSKLARHISRQGVLFLDDR